MSCKECFENKVEIAALEDVVRMLACDIGLQKMSDAYLKDRRRYYAHLFRRPGFEPVVRREVVGSDGMRGYTEEIVK